jgi:transcriptional regulator with XRE-family HTH domain
VRTVEYLEALKKKLGISSDYGLQRPLSVTKQAVSRYRNGGTFDHVVAARVARVLGVPELRVIADMELERAQSEEHRELWRRLARKVAGVLVPAALAIGAASFPMPAEAAFNIIASPDTHCMTDKRRRRRTWWSVLWP